ncbi:hypothetical protein R6Q59_027047 [Mikania micrantha]
MSIRRLFFRFRSRHLLITEIVVEICCLNWISSLRTPSARSFVSMNVFCFFFLCFTSNFDEPVSKRSWLCYSSVRHLFLLSGFCCPIEILKERLLICDRVSIICLVLSSFLLNLATNSDKPI